MKSSLRLTFVGAFVLGAFGLFLFGFLAFGGSRFFASKAQFVTFFTESVKGLDVGALVRFRGVPVGQVTRILIKMDDSTLEDGIPVVYEIDTDRLHRDLGVDMDILDRDVIRQALADGLSVALESESQVTGILSLALDFRPQYAAKNPEALVAGPVPVIPSAPSQLDNLFRQASGIVESLSAFDFAAISTNLERLTETAADQIEAIPVEELTSSLVSVLNQLEARLGDPRIDDLIASAARGAASIEALATTADLEFTDLLPRINALTADLLETSVAIRDLSGRATQVITPDAPLIRDTRLAIRELERTLLALRTLAEYLETNPDSLIRGRID